MAAGEPDDGSIDLLGMLVNLAPMIRRRCAPIALSVGVALSLAAPLRAADPPAPPSLGAAPAVAKLSRRSLAPAPDYALPHHGGTVSAARIAREGWQHCALTFDDGPNEITPHILEILEREHVVATYFPIAATAARHPDVVRAFVADGHEIGNHSLAHHNLAKMSPAAQRADLAEANRILTGLGARPTLFRPPYAAYDARVIESARSVGLETVLWSLDTRDWEYHDAGMLAARVDAGAGPALVVLLHATYPWTEHALPEIIAALRERGCRFVTLSAWIAFMRGGGTPTPPAVEAAAQPPPAAPPAVETTAPAPPRPVVASAPTEAPTTAAATAAQPAPAPVVVAAHETPPAAPEPEPAPAVAPSPPALFTAAPPPAPPAAAVATLAVPPPAPPSAPVTRPVTPSVTPPARPAAAAPPAHPPATKPATVRAAPRPVPVALTLHPATLTHEHGKTELRIVGDDVYLTLGPDADLDAITAQIKDALAHPRR